jgi:hypothetical protein
MRPAPLTAWIYRTMSLTTLGMWSFAYGRYTTFPSSGPGDLIWALGGNIIGLSVWIAPAKERRNRDSASPKGIDSA